MGKWDYRTEVNRLYQSRLLINFVLFKKINPEQYVKLYIKQAPAHLFQPKICSKFFKTTCPKPTLFCSPPHP